MKKKTSLIRYRRVIHVIAALLITSMGLSDLMLYMSYVGGAGSDSAEYHLITEEHELEKAYADGDYDGTNSDSEVGQPGQVDITEEVEGGKKQFVVLEILPTEKKGVVGYTIGGCEPFDVAEPAEGDRFTKKELKMAAMDAMVNPNPGSNNANDQNIVNNNNPASYLKELREKLKESSNIYPFDFEHSKLYNGYYKYVGPNKGFFSIENKTSANPIIKSRFYNTGGSYDYIFVYDQTSEDPDDVNVTNHKRIKYINNEKFIREWLGKDVGIKENTDFEVITRTPVSVTVDEIERADLILLNDAYKGDSYKFALYIQNKIRGLNVETDNGLHFYSPEGDGVIMPRQNRMDFNDFEKVIRIYERVVVREDAAFVAEKTCCTTYYGGEIQQINTNIRKLMFMLFYVQSGNTKQKGRDLFTDYFKRYTSQPGAEYLEKRRQHLENPTKYPVDYRAASLKRNSSDPTNPNYYYMHAHADYHVGHPLVLDRNTAITGADLETVRSGNTSVVLPKLDSDGNIIPVHDQDIIQQRELTIERIDDYQFRDAGIELQKKSTNPGKYYKENDIYKYKFCYESMSNTTDYIYIDNDGRLVIDTKYSSDQNYNPNFKNYWYRIDADYSVEGYAFRRRKWGPTVYDIDDPWPWDSSGAGKPLTVWLMHRQTEGNNYDCNLHMWYDYYDMASLAGMDPYTTIKQPPFGETFQNQSLMEENGFFKGNWIKNALAGRTIKREEVDTTHTVTTVTKDYYYSMNVINGDGVNKSPGSGRNKVLYYNQYEVSKILEQESTTGSAYIPFSIEIKTSCPLDKITVTRVTGTPKSITYDFGGLELEDQDSVTDSSGKLTMTRKEYNDEDGNPKTTTDGNRIHWFAGKINDIFYQTPGGADGWYNRGTNTKLQIDLTVVLPDGTISDPITDEITIVKRDFFMLN